jgi:maltose phosphorylase
MKNYIKHDPWCIIEEGWHPSENKITESLMSLGNGRMGQRANFEEKFTGESLPGNYIAGVYYPDKTKVGWWKNGYPEYFAKVLNACNWIGIHIRIDGIELDLNEALKVDNFKRVLDMRDGTLFRTCEIELKDGKKLKIESLRFCSMADDEAGAVKYVLTPLNFSAEINYTVFADADVKNSDSNYDEKFWEELNTGTDFKYGFVTAITRKTGFHVCTGFKFSIHENQEEIKIHTIPVIKEKYAGISFTIDAKQNSTYCLYKFAANLSSLNHEKGSLISETRSYVDIIFNKGFDQMLEEQKAAWAAKWLNSDIIIEGDIAAQQGIRFNIFQLNQTYTGEDSRLNIGPKGFTGEKYGGSTYWDTEAYCVPFYLGTAPEKVTKQLLLYRYEQLDKAIENATKLGFKDGAALYPMVTMNGEECHNEWEITFEEIHRNGAIAYAIYNYANYTGDYNYFAEAGAEVVLAIARFWTQRVNWSADKNKYVILGVTGPNEYENNVNNSWYTNYLAAWCLNFSLEVIDLLKTKYPDDFNRIKTQTNFMESEMDRWNEIAGNMFLPYDHKQDIILQQEGYLDKEQRLANDLTDAERPLHQKWSWDRILRSCFIKQADVLQGIYFFEGDFDRATIERNFNFYEARTVHESSLSPCVHCILASRIGNMGKAYEMYLRTSRLDLDDYNNDTEDGCHITSMAGTWLSIVQGFAGMRIIDGTISFDPFLPKQWKEYSFKIGFRGVILKLSVWSDKTELENCSSQPIRYLFKDQEYELSGLSVVIL